jgi:putative addiction module CopG family antidote
MQTRTVKLTDRLNAYIEEAVASGRYVDASDVIRESLRLLALREWEDGTAPASAPLPAGATVSRDAA